MCSLTYSQLSPDYLINVRNNIYSFMMHGCLNIIVNWINNDFNIHSHKLAEIIYHVCNVILAEPVSDAETSTANIK